MGPFKVPPLTRDTMREFYRQHPMDPVSPEVESLTEEVKALIQTLGSDSRILASAGLPEIPSRIDENFWRNRMFCEESASALQKINTLSETNSDASNIVIFIHEFTEAENFIHNVQQENNATVTTYLKNFLPNDFRAAILEGKKKSDEENFETDVKKLMERGGTIRQKYDLCLEQQGKRREQIRNFADDSNFNKVLLLLAGIPDELLDFARQIDAKEGPLEEQRLRYGPDLYKVSALGDSINTLIAIWLNYVLEVQEHVAAILAVLSKSVPVYCKEVRRVLGFIGGIFPESPFFVIIREEPEENGRMEKSEESKANEPLEMITGGFKKLWDQLTT